MDFLQDKCSVNRLGTSLRGLVEGAEAIGFRAIAAQIDFNTLKNHVRLPCIIHWSEGHYLVVYRIKNRNVYVADPQRGRIRYSQDQFLTEWIQNKQDWGVALILEPSISFEESTENISQKAASLVFFLSYLKPFKIFFIQLGLGLLAGSVIQLIFPFLTQTLVDFGIGNQNVDYVYLVLIAQLVLFLSRSIVDFVRSWILLHLSTRINISLLSDFIAKLTRLPISFFDTRMIGDILQRIGDHTRIQGLLSSTTLITLFSVFNLVAFGIVLAIYSSIILAVFLVGSLLGSAWLLFFMRRRREIDQQRFGQLSSNQSNIIQLIIAMQEVKLNGWERLKRTEWEEIQAAVFKLNMKGLSVSQYQQAGSIFLNETKNILITFLAAKQVISGDMTIGMMMAVSYIIGQMNSPIDQLLGLFQVVQDGKLSLDRLAEIYQKEDEEMPGAEILSTLPTNTSMSIKNLSFRYGGSDEMNVLTDVSFDIPWGKITAIVGSSGSGKTTLLKLLLRFYVPVRGDIKIGDESLSRYSVSSWRNKCGVVMQDGFIFSDTIERNIAPQRNNVDRVRFSEAVRSANVEEFVDVLPLKYKTEVGVNGIGLSEGQKQRILIARALYRQPDYLFFDEATSSLDAKNENLVMKNIRRFLSGKTAVIIAHRLSTVKNADNIIVLHEGKIAEQGSHNILVAKRGLYYNLIKNQLESKE